MTYCFLDLETTGLEPDADTILEIAWVFTDKHFDLIAPMKSFLVKQRAWDSTWHRLNENDVVHKMHSESGLLAALANKDAEVHDLDDIYRYLEKDLSREGSYGRVHLSGRSVHFDKSFLLAEDFDVLFDDSLSASFYHRMLDLSSVKLMLESAGVDPQQFEVEPIGTVHRAGDDVMNDVLYARSLRSYIEAVAL